jgi:methionyl-tRNA formyltransferase
MSNIYINFFGSSSFVIGILKNITENKGKKLFDVFEEQLLWLKENYNFSQVLPTRWLDLNVSMLKKNYSNLSDLVIQPGLVVSQPDRVNRGKKISNPVVKFARECDLRIFTPEKINKQLEEYTNQINTNSFSVVASFGQIISQAVLDSSEYGFINWHPSLLPKYRGPTPMQSAIANGDPKTGLTWIEVGAKMDAGKVLLQLEEGLLHDTTIIDLQNKMQEIGKHTWALAGVAKILSENTLSFSQEEKDVVFCSKLSKMDSLINPEKQSAGDIINLWKAHLEYPGTVFMDSVKFNSQIKLVEISTSPDLLIDGQVVYEDKLWLQCRYNKNLNTFLKCNSKSYIKIFKIRLENGKEINLKGFSYA